MTAFSPPDREAFIVRWRKSSAGDVCRGGGRDCDICNQGPVGILRQLHNEIDAETARAYGWPENLSDDDILHRLVALNCERAP